MSSSFLHRTYEYALVTNRRERKALARHRRDARDAYNGALQERVDAWRFACREAAKLGLARYSWDDVADLDSSRFTPEQRHVHGLLLAWQGPTLRSQRDSLAKGAQREVLGEVAFDAHTQVTRWALGVLDDAYGRFMAARADGKRAGRPRFRSWKRCRTFGLDEYDHANFREPKAWVPGKRGIGLMKVSGLKDPLRVRMERPLPEDAEIRSVTFTEVSEGRWKVGLSLRMPVRVGVETLAALRDVVEAEVHAVDAGVVALATDQDGIVTPNVRAGEKVRKAVRRQQRAVSRCSKGSRRRKKRVAALGRLRRHEANVRRDGTRKGAAAVVARALANGSRVVAVEDLSLANMVRSASGTMENPGTNVSAKSALNRVVLDAGMGLFLKDLKGKAESAGLRVTEVHPSYTSLTCSRCMGRDGSFVGRTFACPCGLRMDRDANAARNVRRLATAALRAGPVEVDGDGEAREDIPPVRGRHGSRGRRLTPNRATDARSPRKVQPDGQSRRVSN